MDDDDREEGDRDLQEPAAAEFGDTTPKCLPKHRTARAPAKQGRVDIRQNDHHPA
jgi:hypothetical protein